MPHFSTLASMNQLDNGEGSRHDVNRPVTLSAVNILFLVGHIRTCRTSKFMRYIIHKCHGSLCYMGLRWLMWLRSHLLDCALTRWVQRKMGVQVQYLMVQRSLEKMYFLSGLSLCQSQKRCISCVLVLHWWSQSSYPHVTHQTCALLFSIAWLYWNGHNDTTPASDQMGQGKITSCPIRLIERTCQCTPFNFTDLPLNLPWHAQVQITNTPSSIVAIRHIIFYVRWYWALAWSMCRTDWLHCTSPVRGNLTSWWLIRYGASADNFLHIFVVGTSRKSTATRYGTMYSSTSDSQS